MKKLFLLLFIFTAFSVYAESSLLEEVEVSDEYGYDNVDCRYSGKAKFSIESSGIMYSSNICAKEYKAKTDSIEKAYAEFINTKNYSEIVKVLPAKIPLKVGKYKNNDKIIEFKYTGKQSACNCYIKLILIIIFHFRKKMIKYIFMILHGFTAFMVLEAQGQKGLLKKLMIN